MSDLSDRLRHRNAHYHGGPNPCDLCAAADELDRLRRQVEAVKALHRCCTCDEDGIPCTNICMECEDDWPCPTMRALEGEQP